MKRTLVILTMVFLAAAVFGRTPVTAKKSSYNITFNRPFARGDRFSLKVELSLNKTGHTTFAGSMIPFTHKMKATLSGKVRVLKVNDVGEATMFFFHVAKATYHDGETPVPLGLDGLQLGVSFPSGKAHFVRRDGKSISEDAEMLLSMVFTPPTGENPRGYLAPGHPVKEGDSWPINSEKLAKVLASAKKVEGVKVDPKKVKGTVKLVNVEDWNGEPCYHLKIVADAKDMGMQYFLGSTSLKATRDILLPVSPKSWREKEEARIVTGIAGTMTPPGGRNTQIVEETTINYKSVIR